MDKDCELGERETVPRSAVLECGTQIMAVSFHSEGRNIKILHFVNRASLYKFLPITNLTHFSCIYLFHLSTCFKHHNAHHQEIELC